MNQGGSILCGCSCHNPVAQSHLSRIRRFKLRVWQVSTSFQELRQPKLSEGVEIDKQEEEAVSLAHILLPHLANLAQCAYIARASRSRCCATKSLLTLQIKHVVFPCLEADQKVPG